MGHVALDSSIPEYGYAWINNAQSLLQLLRAPIVLCRTPRVIKLKLVWLLIVTSRQVVWLFLEQLRLEFVPVLHRLQGRLAAQG